MRGLALLLLGMNLLVLQHPEGKIGYDRDDAAPFLNAAHLRPELRRKILLVVFGCKEQVACWDAKEEIEVEKQTMVEEMRPGPGGQRSLLVWAGGEDYCGGTGNCSLWICNPVTGDVLLESMGWTLDFERTQHAGRYDVRVSANGGGNTDVIYRFDGRRYRESRRVDHPVGDDSQP